MPCDNRTQSSICEGVGGGGLRGGGGEGRVFRSGYREGTRTIDTFMCVHTYFTNYFNLKHRRKK